MLSKKLAELRKGKGLSQMELAEKLDVTRQAVSRWETGEAAPSLENLKSLRDLYGVTIDELLSDPEAQAVDVPESVPEPERAAAESAPAPASPRRPRRWGLALLLFLLAAAVIVPVLLTAGGRTDPPAGGYNGPSPVRGEDGSPIQGRKLIGYEVYTFALENAGGQPAPEGAEVLRFRVAAPGISEGVSGVGFRLEAGEKVTVRGAASQLSNAVKYGLLDADRTFYGAEGKDGSLSCTFTAAEAGTYYFVVVNNFFDPVELSGYVTR